MKLLLVLFALAACSEEAAPSPEAALEGAPQIGTEPSAEVAPAAPAATAAPAPQAEVPAEGSSLPVDEQSGSGDDREAAAALAAELMEGVAEETGVPQDEVTEFLQGVTNSAPTATDEDRRAFRPRSARPGRADVRSSCNTISFASECMETSRTATGEGYRSTEAMCVNGIWSTTDPCPEAGRTGTCRITEDQQVVHYYYSPSDQYPDPIARARRVCAGYRGEFFIPRTHPLNGR